MVTLASKPIATVTIEPVGPQRARPREHSIHVLLSLGASEARHSDREHVAEVARRAFAALTPAPKEPQRTSEVSRRSTKPGSNVTTVVGVEGTAMSRGRPTEAAVDRLRDVLVDEGYRVVLREKRECAEPECTVFVVLDWNRPAQVPSLWHSSEVCGGHNYRMCPRCKSTYVLTSVNAAGQAPSVHCEVCGQVIIEWGSSKVWTATLVKKA